MSEENDTLTQEERDALTVWGHIRKYGGSYTSDYDGDAVRLRGGIAVIMEFSTERKYRGEAITMAAEWIRQEEAQT